MIGIGLVFLILASLSKWFLHRSASLSQNFVDGATGFLYGIAIGAMLLGLYLYSRRRSTTGAGPRA